MAVVCYVVYCIQTREFAVKNAFFLYFCSLYLIYDSFVNYETTFSVS